MEDNNKTLTASRFPIMLKNLSGKTNIKKQAIPIKLTRKIMEILQERGNDITLEEYQKMIDVTYEHMSELADTDILYPFLESINVDDLNYIYTGELFKEDQKKKIEKYAKAINNITGPQKIEYFIKHLSTDEALEIYEGKIREGYKPEKVSKSMNPILKTPDKAYLSKTRVDQKYLDLEGSFDLSLKQDPGQISFFIDGESKGPVMLISIKNGIGSDINAGIREGYALSSFELDVLRIISSRWIYSDRRQFTIESIFRDMNGGRDTTLTSALRKALEGVIDKARFTTIEFQIPSNLSKNIRFPDGNKQAGDYTTIEMPLLDVVVYRSKLRNGKVKDTLYEIKNEPALLWYAESRKQIATIDMSLLDMRDSSGSVVVRCNQNTWEIIMYLVRRITDMAYKKDNNKNHADGWNHIRYDSLYSTRGAGINKTNREQELRNKIYVKKVLDLYKEKNVIKGYSEYPMTYGVVEGVEIYI